MTEWSLDAGERIYAVGDIHGRLDLFEQMLGRIRRDNDARPCVRTKVIILGDIVDRGPGSAELVQRLMRYSRATDRFIVLKGNHEQVMVRALEGDFQALHKWLKFGGGATLESWGVPADLISGGPNSEIVDVARRQIGAEAIDWLDRLPLQHRSGDVLYVHAGIRPGVALARQDPNDLLWIGDEFLDHETAHPVLVVHGHSSNTSGPEVMPNRIGVDTGAYRTGRLTTLAMEAAETWILST